MVGREYVNQTLTLDVELDRGEERLVCQLIPDFTGKHGSIVSCIHYELIFVDTLSSFRSICAVDVLVVPVPDDPSQWVATS